MTNKEMKEFMAEIEKALEEDIELILKMDKQAQTQLFLYGMAGATEVPMLIPAEFRNNPYPIMKELIIAGYGWDRSGNWLTIHWGH